MDTASPPADPPPADGAAVGRPVSQFPKQAVVVIHGIGEQIPMDTIRGFVRAVWEDDAAVHDAAEANAGEVWSRPDERTGSLELRRITTRQSAHSATFPRGVRTDFYEMYWADLSAGSTWDQVRSWVGGLLFRPLSRVPKDVRLAWAVLWLISLAVVLLAVLTALPRDATLGSVALWSLPPFVWFAGFEGWQLAIATALLGYITHRLVVPYAGRVVRYTRATPDNIAARENIRKRGLALLEQLHSGPDTYDRIIVVGHSLGSILAYDLISHFWAHRSDARIVIEGTAEFAAVRALEAIAANWDAASPTDYRDAQARLTAALRRRAAADARWLISDFITLGCPLTHAEFLLAKSRDDLASRMRDREYPLCPPLREPLSDENAQKARAAGFAIPDASPSLACFPFGAARGWQLHHAAPFAAVRWTNIYDRSFLMFWGDIVSGPLAPAFGNGIVDVNLRTLRRRIEFFTHTKYWTLGTQQAATPVAVVELRRALTLAGPQIL